MENLNLEAAKKMLQDIDAMLNRTMQKASLSYDKSALNFIISKGFVTVKGNVVTREFHSNNYNVVYGN